ncbi:MAG: hypothetical protein AB8E15_01405 [Bdellovibrionales bacterium]
MKTVIYIVCGLIVLGISGYVFLSGSFILSLELKYLLKKVDIIGEVGVRLGSLSQMVPPRLELEQWRMLTQKPLK